MKKLGKIWFTCASILFMVFITIAFQTFKPVTNVQPDDVLELTGKVISIEEASGFDILIQLENDSHQYYINRGLQNGLSISKLQSDILHKKVTLYSIERWTIFTPDKVMGHIAKIMVEDKVIFNKINNDIHEQTIQ